MGFAAVLLLCHRKDLVTLKRESPFLWHKKHFVHKCARMRDEFFALQNASGGSQAWSVEECNAFDHAAARTPEAFLKR